MAEWLQSVSGRIKDDVHWTLSTVLLHFLIGAWLLYFIVLNMPPVIKKYEDFDIEMPTSALLMIEVTQFVIKYWLLTMFLPVVEILSFMYLRPRFRSLTTWIGSLCTLLLMAIYANVTIGVMLPIIN